MLRFISVIGICVAFACTAATPLNAQSSGSAALDAGWEALQDGDGLKAATAFRRAIDEHPDDAAARLGAGAAAHLLGNDDEAKGHLRRALDLEPRLTPASQLLGAIAYDQGDIALAIKTYEQALAQAPRNRALREQLDIWRAEASKTRYTNGPYTIMFEGPAEEALASRAAAVLDAAYWRIAKALAAYPSEPISVVLYTEKQFHDVTGAPEWSAGSFDTRIRIPVGGALRSTAQFDRVLTHELAHAMIASIAPQGVPSWLHEGLAVHLEPGDVDAAERRLKLTRTFVPLGNLDGGFGRLTDRQARVAYDESLVAARALVERMGTNIGLLLQDLGRGQDFATSIERYGISAADFEADLARRIKGHTSTASQDR